MEGESTGLENIIEKVNKVGKWCLAINAGVNFARAYNGEISWTSFTTRTIMSVVEYGSFHIPKVGPAVGVTLIVLEITGTFDKTIYNDVWLNDKSRYIRYDFAPTYYQKRPVITNTTEITKH